MFLLLPEGEDKKRKLGFLKFQRNCRRFLLTELLPKFEEKMNGKEAIKIWNWRRFRFFHSLLLLILEYFRKNDNGGFLNWARHQYGSKNILLFELLKKKLHFQRMQWERFKYMTSWIKNLSLNCTWKERNQTKIVVVRGGMQ